MATAPASTRAHRSAPRLGRWLTLAGALLVARASPADPASDDSAAEVQRLESELRRLRSIEARYQRTERGVLAEIERLEHRALVIDKELQLTQVELSQGELQAAQLEQESARLSDQLERDRAGLRLSLRTVYERRTPDWLTALLAGGGPGEFRRELHHLSRLSQEQNAALARCRQAQEQLAANRRLVAEQNLRLGELRARAEAERRRLGETRAERGRSLSQIQVRRQEAERQRRQAAVELSSLVEGLGNLATPPLSTGFRLRRGHLPWPAEGLIRKGFGIERHERFRTETSHPGVDIEVAEGVAVHAVHAGEVAYADWFKGYGNLVILDHGDGYYTLYAHLLDLAVTRGAAVTAGQTLGRAGDTGAMPSPGLYFEIREGSRAVDPERWLERR